MLPSPIFPPTLVAGFIMGEKNFTASYYLNS
jgi:hypothetical protein